MKEDSFSSSPLVVASGHAASCGFEQNVTEAQAAKRTLAAAVLAVIELLSEWS
jgi:hypothetical protein